AFAAVRFGADRSQTHTGDRAMQNGKMTREESIALLKKLSHDDAFRAVFEKDPVAGLKQIGIDAGKEQLPASALAPEKLAPKEQFQQALKDVTELGTSDHVCLIAPLLKLTFGDAGGSSRA
ncbi:MAG: NHLP-related RiPP peptide, partial [Rhodanobacteraceae bacterium]